MTREDFMRIFIDVSNKIISLGIDKGYFDPSKKEELEDKLRSIINKDIQELDNSQGLAYFNPNNQTLGFNINQIATEGDAITLILHEEKHILDQYYDCDNSEHVDNSHVGFHQQHSGIGIGQNESITDRFAIEMAKSFSDNNIRTTSFNAFNLSFQTDMVRYQVEDKLNQLLCASMGITLDELISMQNDENMDRLNELIAKFNEFADYDRYSAAIDGIYDLRYGANGKEDEEFTEEDIRKMHEYIQLAQDELEKYIAHTTPEKLEEINAEFIATDPKYKIDDKRKNDLVNRIHGSRTQETSDSSLADMFSMLRGELETDSIKTSLQLNEQIQRLIKTGTIICGKIIKENGIVRLERVAPSQIESIPEDERGFATASMGRAIFTISKDGSIHNFKGVDSHLSTSELGPMDLVNARSIEYAPRTNGYKVSAVVFNDKKPEIRINGTSPLEDIEIEGDINKRLAEMGIKVPTISYIREIPQDFSIKYGLPIKVDGSLDDFESDYAVEDDERKKRLEEIYGSNYSQELGENQRPESMREYLQRIGFLSSPEVQSNIESLGYSMQDFIDAVDSSYSRGQRYGQAERTMGSPFRISDLETCIANGNIEQLQAIMDFSEMQNGNFTEQLAEVFGRNIATLMSNGWECENLIHRQDFSLTGEFCDDSYFDIFEKYEEMKEKYKAEPYKTDALMGEIRRKYTGQVMHIASCIKVVQNAMSLTGKSKEQIDSILDTFVGSFANNLDLQKIGQLFQIDEATLEETLMREFREGQNWTEKMAGQERREGLVMDEAIYNSHIGNEEFYAKVSELITERIRVRQIQKGKKELELQAKKYIKSTQALGKETLEEQRDTALLDEIEQAQVSQERAIIVQRESTENAQNK